MKFVYSLNLVYALIGEHFSQRLNTRYLLMKGGYMAVSKHTGASGCDTNPFFLEHFRDHSESDERERRWHTAMVHAGEGTPPLRFPVYECLYLINVHSQKLVDLLEEVSNRFGVEHGWESRPW